MPDLATADSLPAACLNCGEPFGRPRPKYCPACGQESNVKPPTLLEFAQQFGGNYLTSEGALWRTFVLLFTRPGQLTVEYLAGRRRRYLLPLRLYLMISIATLVLMRVLSALEAGDNAVVLEPAATGPQAKAVQFDVDLGLGKAGVNNGVFYCEGLPQWVCRRLERRIGVDPKLLARELEGVVGRFASNLGNAMFVLLPMYALWLRLVYLNRQMRYTEHLVFALHLHAFWFVAMACVAAGWAPLQLLALIAVPTYALMAMRRVYGGRWGPLLARALIVSVLYGVCLALVTGAVAVWSVLA